MSPSIGLSIVFPYPPDAIKGVLSQPQGTDDNDRSPEAHCNHRLVDVVPSPPRFRTKGVVSQSQGTDDTDRSPEAHRNHGLVADVLSPCGVRQGG